MMTSIWRRSIVALISSAFLLSAVSDAGADVGDLVNYLNGFEGGYVATSGADQVPYQVAYAATSANGLLQITETTTYGQFDPSHTPLGPCQGYAPVTRTLQFNPLAVTVTAPKKKHDEGRQALGDMEWSVLITNALPPDPTQMPPTAPPPKPMRLTTTYTRPVCSKLPTLVEAPFVPVQTTDKFWLYFDSPTAAEAFYVFAQWWFYVSPSLAIANSVAVSATGKGYTLNANVTVPQQCDEVKFSEGTSAMPDVAPLYNLLLVVPPKACDQTAKTYKMAPLVVAKAKLPKVILVRVGPDKFPRIVRLAVVLEKTPSQPKKK